MPSPQARRIAQSFADWPFPPRGSGACSARYGELDDASPERGSWGIRLRNAVLRKVLDPAGALRGATPGNSPSPSGSDVPTPLLMRLGWLRTRESIPARRCTAPGRSLPTREFLPCVPRDPSLQDRPPPPERNRCGVSLPCSENCALVEPGLPDVARRLLDRCLRTREARRPPARDGYLERRAITEEAP